MLVIAGSKPQALLFDLDGTLFRTETLSLPAYHATFRQLREEGLYEQPTPPEALFLGSLGALLEEIWRNVMPDASDAARNRANELLLQHQLHLLTQGIGELYPGVASTLATLHAQGIQLFVASNGLEAYVKDVIQATGLAPLFTGLYSAGEFHTRSKIDLVRLLLDQHGLESAWMCGDRASDVEAGRGNQLFVVGCDYAGFHQAAELAQADAIIHAFPDLLTLLGSA